MVRVRDGNLIHGVIADKVTARMELVTFIESA